MRIPNWMRFSKIGIREYIAAFCLTVFLAVLLLAVCAFLPAVSAILPQVVGFEGALIEMGRVEVYADDGYCTLTCEPGTWAEYLVAPMFAEDVNTGVGGAFLGTLSVLQEAGVPLSVPMVYGVAVFLLMIVMEFLDLLLNLVMWIPRRISAMFERS